MTWNSPGDTGVPGRLTISGSTGYGEVTAVVDVVASYAGPACDSTVTGTYHGPLTVSSGTTCLEGAAVSGPVRVRAGAGLVATGATISGPVSASGAEVVALCRTRVNGPVSLTGGSSVTIGNPVLDCAPNRVTGPVTVTNTVGWNVIAGNAINGPLSCIGNQPAPVNNGSTNQVRGPESGQCTGL